METLLITSIFVITIGLLIKWVIKYKNYGIKLNEENGFKFLLGWLIFGFFLRLDYSDNWGCVVGLEPFWEPRNILFSAISIGIIYWAFKTENQNLKKILCLTEMVYWISKLIIFKGGYVVGFGGVPDPTIVFYDLVSALSRLFIISQVVNVQRFKFFKIAIVALLIMGIKIEIFSTPPFMVYEENQAIERAKEIRNEVIGKWKGRYQKMEYENILSSGELKIEIDSNLIKFKGVKGLEEYQLNLSYSYYGTLSKTGEYSDYEITIEKLEKDSLVFKIFYFGDEYKFKMKKENEI